MALSEQQKHLLGRIPNWYEVKKNDEPQEPANVARAHQTIADWNAKTEKARKDREKSFSVAVTDAREAVYFLPVEKALEKIKAFEAKFGKK